MASSSPLPFPSVYFYPSLPLFPFEQSCLFSILCLLLSPRPASAPSFPSSYPLSLPRPLPFPFPFPLAYLCPTVLLYLPLNLSLSLPPSLSSPFDLPLQFPFAFPYATLTQFTSRLPPLPFSSTYLCQCSLPLPSPKFLFSVPTFLLHVSSPFAFP